MSYTALARYYDGLMSHVDYEGWADHFLSLAGQPRQVLDLACGTGRFTEILCRRGYDVVAVDGSADMLAMAQSKGIPALFLHQDMTQLDLYGTVQGVFCTLDGINHLLDPSALQRVFERVALFLEPGGFFVFDVLTESALANRDGHVFTAESKEACCVWQSQWDAPFSRTQITLFARRRDGLWRRAAETNTERAYTPSELTDALERAGFAHVNNQPAPPRLTQTGIERLVVQAQRQGKISP